MSKPTETGTGSPEKPKPVDDPLVKLVDQFSDEIEPIATTPGDSQPETPATPGETPTTSQGDQGPTV